MELCAQRTSTRPTRLVNISEISFKFEEPHDSGSFLFQFYELAVWFDVGTYLLTNKYFNVIYNKIYYNEI